MNIILAKTAGFCFGVNNAVNRVYQLLDEGESVSTLGPIIPPSMPLVVYGMVSGVSVGALLVAGVLPGVVIALCMWYYLNRTTPGLRLRAVGENPGSADSVGINIKRYKYLHIMLGCGIMGIGGYYMGLNMSGSFNSACWINGYGWIAVALVIFANWSPLLAILGTFVFGFFNTLQVSGSTLAGAFPEALSWLTDIPSQLYQALPFIITAIVLFVSSVQNKRSSGQPAALGLNYFREER